MTVAMLVQSCWLDDDRNMCLEEANRTINEAERARGRKFRFLRDRQRYVRGRAFLRKSLAKVVGGRPHDIELRYEPGGKPFLPAGPHFNFTRSGPLAVLGISHEGPVGVDLEYLYGDFDTEEVAEECFSTEELAALAGLSGPAKKERFFAFWTAKEARLKLTGEGLSREPRSIELHLADGWPVGCFEERVLGSTAAFQYFRLAEYLCCIATPPANSANSRVGLGVDTSPRREI